MIKRLIKASCLSLSIIAAGFLYYLLITHSNFHFICVFYTFTGLYCPGCGMTRCVLSLFNGDLYQAFRYNALAFFIGPFILAYMINRAYKYITQKKETFFDKIPEKKYLILAIITILFAILRNIPYFSFLAPTTV